MDWTVGVPFPAGVSGTSLPQSVQPAKLLRNGYWGLLPPGVNSLGREDDHSPLHGVMVN